MALPNMAMIPSGYKPTKLYSVLPTPENGSEVIVNGDFAADSDWTKAAAWTISGGSANTDGTINSAITQSNVTTIGKQYKYSFDVLNSSVGDVRGRFRNDGVTVLNFLSEGTYSGYFVGTGTLIDITTLSTNTATFSIDNVSVQEVITADADFTVTRASSATRVNEQGLIETPEFILSDDKVTNGDFGNGATDWTVNNNASPSTNITNGALNIVTTTGFASVTQSNVMTVGKQYKVTLDVVATNGRQLALDTTSSIILDSSTVGKKVVYFTTDSTQLYIKRINNDTDVTIDNISVVEVERENIPRLDYTDGGCPVLLTEPQSTNLITDSQDLASLGVAGNAVVTSNAITSPSGLLDADEITFDGTLYGRVESSILATIGQPYTISLYLKNKDLSDTTQVWIGFSQTNVGQFVTITNEWRRYYVTINADGSNEYPRVQFTGTGSLYAWGFQVEQLSYATSYIPTYGQTASRASESVSNAGNANTYNDSEGVLFFEGSFSDWNVGGEYQLSISDGTGNNRIMIFPSSQTNVGIRFNANSVQLVNQALAVTDISVVSKLAVAWGGGNYKLYQNGVEIYTQAIADTPTGLSKLNLGSVDGSAELYGKTSQVQVFNTALSDFELGLLTSQDTNYDSYEAMRLALNYNIQ